VRAIQEATALPFAIRALAAGLASLSFACGSGDSPSDPADAGTPDSGRPPPISANTDGWWRGAVAYEVFVRSFADSDGDGVGDLPGLIGRLDYLNDGDPSTTSDLGVDALWLMPIHPSPSYHGYDITDYLGVRAEYGTLEDFDELVAQAHARGMRLIMDLALNHSSEEHPWFLDAQQGPEAQYRDFYNWSAEDPGWRRPWDNREVWYELNGSHYYGVFGADLPDLNLGNPAVEEEMFEVMRFWAARGLDGFRVDAARHLFESEDGQISDLPQTHTFVQRLRERLHAEYPQALLLAEAWIGVDILKDYYGDGYEYQLAFSFDVAAQLKAAVADGTTDGLRTLYEASNAAFPDRGFEAPFISNHDQDRAMRTFGKDFAKARLAAATLMASPGTPFIYYGEELGMAGGNTPFDEDKRQPFRWTDELPGVGFSTVEPWYRTTEDPGVDVAAQREVPGSLWTFYRDLITTKKASPALADGDQTLVTATGGDGLLAWTRAKGGDTVLFVANYADTAAGPISIDVRGTPTLLFAEGVSTSSVSGTGPITLDGLPAKGFAFIGL